MSTSYLNRLGAIDFSRTIERLAEGFTGREWLFDKLDDWLQQKDGEKFYLLTGEPGVGKSAIAAQLTQRWADKDPENAKLAAYHFCRAGDVETVRPGQVLRSLATQLGKTLPHYGEALKEVLDQVHVRIDVNINIDRLSNSQVTGIYVENLKELDPREEFRLLIQAPLTALSKIYTTLGETPPALKVFLIDSLDEAARTTGQENMVTLLASLYQARETLPPWVRFLLTARPDRSVLNRFLPLQSQKIEELEAKNLSDIQRYAQGRVDEQLREERSTPEPQTSNAIVTNPKSLQQRLEEAELTAEKLVDEVKELSHGNFLYTKLLLNSIASGEQSIKNLSALPKDLNEIYHRILRYRCSFRGWLKRYQPILGTLSVTQEPISQAQLSKFTRIDAEELEKNLAVFRQFLDESKDEQGQPLYTIFHQSLREYLLDRNHNHDFWCDAKEQHDGIIQCFEDESEKWQNLRAIDLYGLRHLAQHLVRANQVDELHRLLNREKDGRNAWFSAKDDVAETAGFLADVELAWSRADEMFECEPRKIIELQCRYALIKTSINSLAEIPITLMIALVEYKHWKPAKALAYACQIPDPQHRVGSLTALATKLPNTEPLKQQILQIALQETQSIQEPSARAYALTALANDLPVVLSQALETIQAIKIQDRSARAQSVPAYALLGIADKLTPALLPKALEVVQAIQDEYWRAYALAGLAVKLTQELLPKALEIAQEIQRDDARAKALTSLVKLQPELLPKVLEAAQSIQDDMSRAGVLIDLVDKLPSDLLPKVLEVVQLIQDDYQRAGTLVAFVNKLPGVLSNILEAIQSIQDSSSQAIAIASLVNKFSSELPPQILDLAQSIQDNTHRADALTVLAHKLPEAIPQTLNAIQLVQSDYYRAENIIALVNKLAPELLPQALEAAQSIQDSYERARVLIALTDKRPEILPKTIDAVQAIQDDYHCSAALVALVNKVPPKQLPELLEMVHSIQGDYERARALTALAEQLPEVLPQALEAAQSIKSAHSRAQALTALINKLPEVLPRAVEGIKAIQLSYARNEALTTLLNSVPPELLPKALEAVQLIQDDYPRACALTALVNDLPEVLSQALEAVQAIRDDNFRALVLTVLSGKLTKELLPKALELAQSIQDDRSYTDVLIVLVERLTPELLAKVLETAQSIGDDYNRARVLTALTNKLPDLLPKALESARSIQSEYNRVEVLTALLDRLTPDLLPVALEVVQSIRDEYNRTQMLIALANKLPEAIHQALESAQLIQRTESRAQVMASLVDKLPELLPQALEAAQSVQDDYDRAQALNALAAKAPELLPQALEAAQSVQDDYDRVSALIALVDELPELLPQALEAAQSIQNVNLRASALTKLVDNLPELFSQALEAAQLIPYDSRDEGRGDYARAQALTALLDKLPPALLPQTLEAAQSTQGAHDRAQVLTVLAKHLVNASNCSDLWKNSLHFFSSRTRSDLLSDFTALSPLMIALGDKSSTLEIIRAIQDVCKWWA